MPEKTTIQRARRDEQEGKAPTTQAGEFVREEMEHVKRGKHGVRSRKQAIAIGLSKARRAGVDLPPPGRGQAKRKTRQGARSAHRRGRSGPLAGKRSASQRSSARTASRMGSRSSTRGSSRGSRGGSRSRRGARRSR